MQYLFNNHILMYSARRDLTDFFGIIAVFYLILSDIVHLYIMRNCQCDANTYILLDLFVIFNFNLI